MYKSILLIAFAIGTTLCHSATITATIPGGNWNSGTSWVGGIVPISGVDDVIIPAGSTITITGTVNFNGIITVGGTLSLQSSGFGNLTPGLLLMDTNSTVDVLSGGEITSGGGGLDVFNSITIGVAAIYNPGILGSPSPLVGPKTIDETSGVVPIKLLSFEANLISNTVALSWATATEENFDYFALERSADGENFFEIAQIRGMGDSFSRIDYSYEDEFPLIGRSYYRLRSVDFDGYTEIFDYVMVMVEGTIIGFNVFPNPISNGGFSIQTNFESESSIKLIVYNSMGAIERSYHLDSWMNNLDLDGLKPGSYLVKLISKEGVIVKRILVN